MIHQLIYSGNVVRHDIRPPVLADAQLAISLCQTQNVNGLTLFADGVFLTVLEGKKPMVDGVMDRIDDHPRLTQTQILLSDVKAVGDFQGYNIGFLRRDFSAQLPEAFLITKDAVTDLLERVSPDVAVMVRTFIRINIGWAITA